MSMKTLYLIRHAKSSWKNLDIQDIQRPLKKRGKKDASLMVQSLIKKNIKPDIIITSPAKRAIETAKILAGGLNYPVRKIVRESSLYYDGATEFLELIHNIDNSLNHVFLICHNPELTDYANYFSNQKVDNISTCGIYCLEFDIKSWKEVSANSGKLVFFDYPKKHK